MLSRRNVRIKVMQSLYAFERDAFPTELAAKKYLNNSLQQAHTVSLYLLYLLRETANYAYHEAELRAAKHLPTDEDLNFSTRLAQDNSIIEELNNSTEFGKKIEALHFKHFEEDGLTKKLFKSLLKKQAYKNYVALPKNELKDDREILLTLFNKVFSHEEDLQNHLEEHFPNWIDDKNPISFKISQILEQFQPEKSLEDALQNGISDEDMEFAQDLFETTLEHTEEYDALIAPKLVNWDLERIAVLDMILMKMALAELLNFKFIPIKVSINEYIEIAKVYSTPKSKDFVNGVLDKLMKELKESGKIKKAGRGLLG